MTTETAPAAPQAVSGKEYQLLINGQHVAPKSGEMMERRYPANNDVTVAKFPKANEEDVDAAIEAARKAFDSGGWSNAPARNRSAVLRRAADKIRAEQSDLARLLASEVGKPLSEAGIEVALTADVFEYYAGLALDIKGQVISNYVSDAIGMILKEPVGVVGIITPWNFPMLLASDVHAVHDVRAGAHPDGGGRAGGRGERRDWLGQDGGRADRRFAAGG